MRKKIAAALFSMMIVLGFATINRREAPGQSNKMPAERESKVASLISDSVQIGKTAEVILGRAVASPQDLRRAARASRELAIAREVDSVAFAERFRAVGQKELHVAQIAALDNFHKAQLSTMQLISAHGTQVSQSRQAAVAQRSAAAQAGFSQSSVAAHRFNANSVAGRAQTQREMVHQMGRMNCELIRAAAAMLGAPSPSLVQGGDDAISGAHVAPIPAIRREADNQPASSAPIQLPIASKNAATISLKQLKPDDCRPKLDRSPSIDSKVLRLFGLDDRSCCGSSRRCENLPPGCFPGGTQRLDQERTCYEHDLDLSGESALDLKNPVTRSAHGKAADKSTSLPIKAFLGLLHALGHAPKAEDYDLVGPRY